MPSGYVFSHCAIRMIKSILFSVKNELKEDYKCLITENSSFQNKRTLEDYKQLIARNELPGYYMSLSDQCRLITGDKYSFMCTELVKDMEKICTSRTMGCYNTAKDNCHKVYRPLDGTPCKKHNTFFLFELVLKKIKSFFSI